MADKRIKTNIQESDYQNDLTNLINLNTYEYDDINQKFENKLRRKGMIAQEVEKILKNSVKKYSNFIPNIYKKGFIVNGNVINVDFEPSEDIVSGKMLKFMIYKISNDEGEFIEMEIKTVGHNQLILKETIDLNMFYDEIWVEGVRVDNFKQVNNDDLLYISIGAIKQLKKENDILKEKLDNILSKLENENK